MKQKKFATNVTGPNGTFVIGNPRPIKLVRGYAQRSGGGYMHPHSYPDSQYDGRFDSRYNEMGGQYGAMQYGHYGSPINGSPHFGGSLPMQYGFVGDPSYMQRGGLREKDKNRRNRGESNEEVVYMNAFDQYGNQGPYAGQY